MTTDKAPQTSHIYMLSACDRFNYGDLLFPIVAKHELSQLGSYEFHNIANIASDLSSIGALPTIGYEALLDFKNVEKNSTLLVAGGQVLNANWSRLVSFLTPKYHDFYEKYKGARLEKIAKKRFGNDCGAFPFMPSNETMLAHYNVVYHGVGGGLPKRDPERQEAKTAIDNAAYLSVRERQTQTVLKKNFDANATLVPDSVAVISDIFPKDTLSKEGLPEAYACVQFGYFKVEGKHQMILNQLRKVHHEHGLTIGLLSIGNCPGHDDEKMVEWIQKHADFPTQILPSDNIDNITRSLAHASIYIGTSLHGVIVSMSYGNPFVGVNRLVHKVDAYSKTWAPKHLKGSVGFVQIANTVTRRLQAHYDYGDIIEEHKRLVRASFARVHESAQTALR